MVLVVVAIYPRTVKAHIAISTYLYRIDHDQYHQAFCLGSCLLRLVGLLLACCAFCNRVSSKEPISSWIWEDCSFIDGSRTMISQDPVKPSLVPTAVASVSCPLSNIFRPSSSYPRSFRACLNAKRALLALHERTTRRNCINGFTDTLHHNVFRSRCSYM